MIKPYKTQYYVSQGFAKNFSTHYVNKGLLGHNGIDMVGAHLTPIINVTDSYCYSHRNRENMNLNEFRAVYTLVEISGSWYEISYGHLIDILVFPKTYLKEGTQVGTQGNTGFVFVNGVAPTYEERKRGRGSHLHFQMRAVKQVDKRDPTKHYLTDSNGTLKYLDKYWEVIDYDNGFHGCVDPQPFLDNIPKENLTDTLRYGSRGEQVKILQRKLRITDDGVFGRNTSKAVVEFQVKNGLTPDGIVGPKTRAFLNK